ncbi:hypothetical protein BN871_DD_00080 [Paenibacillus sp. P22]|nr:hypothetical protein BN871_DD_00080 [Paenibacillus sp. P22]
MLQATVLFTLGYAGINPLTEAAIPIRAKMLKKPGRLLNGETAGLNDDGQA